MGNEPLPPGPPKPEQAGKPNPSEMTTFAANNAPRSQHMASGKEESNNPGDETAQREKMFMEEVGPWTPPVGVPGPMPSSNSFRRRTESTDSLIVMHGSVRSGDGEKGTDDGGKPKNKEENKEQKKEVDGKEKGNKNGEKMSRPDKEANATQPKKQEEKTKSKGGDEDAAKV